ncbi:MAG: hypothetical protein Q8L15_18545 [Methylobacter sp.]|nr:hypothetical protein [Methylobacter sp.]
MKITIILGLALIAAFPAKAEVFKCKSGESKTIYQPNPCATDESGNRIEIKQLSREKTAQAEAKLKAWYAERDAKELANYKAWQEEELRKLRISEADSAQRNADAQVGQKDALDRQARAMEKQNVRPKEPPVIH